VTGGIQLKVNKEYTEELRNHVQCWFVWWKIDWLWSYKD